MNKDVGFRRVAGFVSACLVMTVVWLVEATWTDVHATTIYSYTDDRGHPVYTDDLQKVPQKYREKVQRFEKVSEQQFSSKLRSFRFNMSGLSEEQATVLNYAGGAAVFLLIMMYFSKNSPMIRLLALALLILLGIGTPVLMYSGEGGALNVMKKKADEASQLNSKRLKQASPQ